MQENKKTILPDHPPVRSCPPPVLALFEWHHLGDAVLSFPFVKSATLAYEVHVFCRPGTEALYSLLLPPDRIHPCLPDWCNEETGARTPPSSGITGCETIVEQIRRLSPQIGVCAWVDPRVFSLMVRAGIPQRIGLPLSRNNYFTWEASLTKCRRLQVKLYEIAATLAARSRLVTDPVERADYHQPRWKDWRQVGAKLGLTVNFTPPWFDLPSEPGVKAAGRTWLIHPGARQAIKRWPAARFEQLIREHVLASGAKVLLVDLPDCKLSLPELPALSRVSTSTLHQLAASIKLADWVLCHDSLPAHLAAGLGRPVVALFGDMPSCWFAPFGCEKLVVSTPPDSWPLTREQLEASGRSMLDRVTVESVWDKMQIAEAGQK